MMRSTDGTKKYDARADYEADSTFKMISFLRYSVYDEDLEQLVELVKEADQDFLEMDSSSGIEPEPFAGETLGPISFQNEEMVHISIVDLFNLHLSKYP